MDQSGKGSLDSKEGEQTCTPLGMTQEAEEARDADGRSALHRAAVAGRAGAAAALLAAGADARARDALGATPLLLAAYWGHAHVAECLLRAGARPDEEFEADLRLMHREARIGGDFRGRPAFALSALHVAAGAGHVDTLQVRWPCVAGGRGGAARGAGAAAGGRGGRAAVEGRGGARRCTRGAPWARPLARRLLRERGVRANALDAAAARQCTSPPANGTGLALQVRTTAPALRMGVLI
ncbi:Uncharacterized protein GBIM_20180, partial [Gryllus bimaculatus]